MNKKVIIGVVIVGVLIVGGVYLYNRNKKPKNTNATDTQPSNLATEIDAMEIIEISNKSNTPYTPEQTKVFVELYTSNIDKDTHAKIKSTMSKKSRDWNLQDRANLLVLLDKVTKPLANRIAK